MKSNFTRGLVAMATALACLLMFQSPASAAVHSAEITGGTIVLTKTGTTPSTISLTSTVTTCPAGTLDVDVTPDTAPDASVQITALSKQGRFTLGTTDYVSVLTLVSSTAGTSTATGVSNVGATIKAEMYNLSGDCGLGTKICEYRSVALVFQGTHSGFPIGSTSTATLSAPAANIVTGFPPPACGTPFAAYTNGGQATVNGMTLTITT